MMKMSLVAIGLLLFSAQVWAMNSGSTQSSGSKINPNPVGKTRRVQFANLSKDEKMQEVNEGIAAQQFAETIKNLIENHFPFVEGVVIKNPWVSPPVCEPFLSTNHVVDEEIAIREALWALQNTFDSHVPAGALSKQTTFVAKK